MSFTFSRIYRWPSNWIMASNDKLCIHSACSMPQNERTVMVLCASDLLWLSGDKVQQTLLLLGLHRTICLLSSAGFVTTSHTKEWVLNTLWLISGTINITNSTEQSPFKDANSHSTGHEILHLICNLKIHYLFYKSCHWTPSQATWTQLTLLCSASLRSILILPYNLPIDLPSLLLRLCK